MRQIVRFLPVSNLFVREGAIMTTFSRNMRSSKLYATVFLILCIGMVFTDLPIYEKTVTHSLMVFFAPFVFVFILVLKNFRLQLTKNSKLFLSYVVISLLFSLLLLYLLILTTGESYAYGISMLVKTFEAFTSLSLLHFIVYYLLVSVFRTLPVDKIKRFFTVLFICLTFVGVIEYLYPEKLELFHATPKEYARLRLFTSEPSHAVLLYVVVSLLTLFFSKSIYSRILVLIFSGAIFILINSKGGFFAIFLTLVISFLRRGKNVKHNIALFFMILLSTYLILRFLIPALSIDIREFSSLSTRFSGFVSALIILLKYPLGLGYGSYLFYYPEVLSQSFGIAANLFKNFFGISLSSYEILYIISTGKNLGAKAGIPQSIVFSGWIAVIFWLVIFRNSFNYIKNLNIELERKITLELVLLYTVIQLFIGSEYTLLYVLWVPIALIESMYYNQKEVMQRVETQTSFSSSAKPISTK